MTPIRLKSYEFRREREATWRKLEALVGRVERGGLRALSGEQLSELPVLYRAALSSLSVARAISLDRNLLDYLESLCERAYFCVYQSRRHLRETIFDFLVRQFPRAVRRFRWHLAITTLFLLLGGFTGYKLTMDDPQAFHSFVSDEYAQGRGPEASRRDLARWLTDGSRIQTDQLGLFSTQLFTHNASVSIVCFTLGFVAGIPVFLYMASTGLLAGAFIAVYAQKGLTIDIWAWLLPHGVTEILAFLLAGAGGLAVAQSLIFPGRYGRLENLARVGRSAGTLVIGAVLMLLISGFIEGIFRQRVTDVGARLTMAGASAAFWLLYFTFCGRKDRT